MVEVFIKLPRPAIVGRGQPPYYPAELLAPVVDRCKDDFREFVDTLVVALRQIERAQSPPGEPDSSKRVFEKNRISPASGVL